MKSSASRKAAQALVIKKAVPFETAFLFNQDCLVISQADHISEMFCKADNLAAIAVFVIIPDV